jgi:YtkA-like
MGRHRTALTLALALAGCGGASAPAPAGSGTGGVEGPTGATGPAPSVLVAEGRAGEWNVQVLSDRVLGTGLASLTVRLVSGTGLAVTDAAVTFAANRPATGMIAPVPAGPRPGEDGAYHVDVSLAEAASAADGWTFQVGSTRAGVSAAVALPGIAVLDRRLAGTFTQGDTTILLAVRFETGLRVGSNPVTVALHQVGPAAGSADPVVDASFHVEPYMPSMGHGSSGSVDPVPTATPGVYAGSLAFSMPGDWETSFAVTRGGVEVGRVAIAVAF